jgi:hypothetical protein
MFHKYIFSKKRDVIDSSTPIGTILKVYPKLRSHSIKPYRVVIIENTKWYFMTRLLHPEKHSNPHVRTFHYRSEEWKNYHNNRFRKIGKINTK